MKLIERIRSSAVAVKQFKLNEFKKLKSLKDCVEYAMDTLQFLGTGSSRYVFILNSRKVLKIARDQHDNDGPLDGAGIAQNHLEFTVSKNANVNDCISLVYDADPGFRWIISDLVKEIDSQRHLESTLNIRQGQLWNYIEEVCDGVESIGVIVAHYASTDANVTTLTDFSNSLRNLVRLNNLSSGDVSWHHFGITRDRRIVLFDYGLSYDVYNQYYAARSPEIS